MIIKRYNDFKLFTENKYIDVGEKHGSLAQYVGKLEDSLSKDGEDMERFRQIVGKHLIDGKTDPYINIENSVEILNEVDQRLLVKELKGEFNYVLSESSDYDDSKQEDSEKDSEEQDSDEEISEIKDMRIAGKFGFNSFIKVITALGLYDMTPDYDNCPDDFMIIYTFMDLDKSKLISIMNRFKSLNLARKMLKKSKDVKIGLYFGLKYNKKFTMEYGINVDDKRSVCGEFNFGTPQLNKISKNTSKSLKSFKDNLSSVPLNKLKTLMEVKYDLDTFSPGYFQKKSNSVIKDDILSIGYYGVGVWKSGVLDNEDYLHIKEEFNNWILTKKWKSKVTFNVNPGKFWVYFKIKVK